MRLMRFIVWTRTPLVTAAKHHECTRIAVNRFADRVARTRDWMTLYCQIRFGSRDCVGMTDKWNYVAAPMDIVLTIGFGWEA